MLCVDWAGPSALSLFSISLSRSPPPARGVEPSPERNARTNKVSGQSAFGSQRSFLPSPLSLRPSSCCVWTGLSPRPSLSSLSLYFSLSLFRAPARSRPQLGNKRVSWAGWALGSYSLVLPVALVAARGTANSNFARPIPLLQQARAKALEAAPPALLLTAC